MDAINVSSRACLQQLGGPLLDTAKYNLRFYKFVVIDRQLHKYYLVLGFYTLLVEKLCYSGLQQA